MIRVFATPATLADGAAELFVEESERSVKKRGRFAVALAGGNTPRPTYRKLAEPRLRDRVDWNRVHLFWGDERCVPPNDERSNYRMVREALLNDLESREDRIHPIRCAGDPETGARAYEEQLRGFSARRAPGSTSSCWGWARTGTRPRSSRALQQPRNGPAGSSQLRSRGRSSPGSP